MHDPFSWPEEQTTQTAVVPVFDGADPMEVIKGIPPWIPVSPVGAAVRPEWDMRLVVDYVLGAGEDAICEEYGLVLHQWHRILNDIGFLGKVAALKKELEKDGATFALKAKVQAEVLIDESFRMAMDGDVDPRVRAKLIGDTVRWAGYDKNASIADGTGGFSININLNGKRIGDTFDGEAEDV